MRSPYTSWLFGLAVTVLALAAIKNWPYIEAYAHEQGWSIKSDEVKFQEFIKKIANSKKYFASLDGAFVEDGEGSELIAAIAIEKVKASLLDPYSSEFQGVQVAYNAKEDNVYVCGYVNAKNVIGGYVGLKPFVTSVYVRSTYEKTTAASVSFDVDVFSAEAKRKCGLGFMISAVQ